jgi:hypothetical protein
VLQVCSRLGLLSLAYLWHQPQERLLADMVDNDIEAVLVKVRLTYLVEQVNTGKCRLPCCVEPLQHTAQTVHLLRCWLAPHVFFETLQLWIGWSSQSCHCVMCWLVQPELS